MESREVLILIFGQGLFFGNRTEKFLINHNQCQAFGILICDELTDHNRPMGIEAYFNTHFPMSVVGYTCVFIIWYPTYDEIETCQNITVTDEHNWDPSKNIFKISSMEEEQMNNIFNL